MSRIKPKLSKYLLPIGIILIGFALRLYRLDIQFFSGDEAFSIINWTKNPLSIVLTDISLIDPQPPFTLLTIIAWTKLAGITEFSSRFISVLAGTITVATSYRIAKYILTTNQSYFATLLVAFSPFLIWYSQDLRSYALWSATSSVSLLVFIQLQSSQSKFKHWLFYITITTISIFTFYLETFYLVAQNLWQFNKAIHTKLVPKRWIISQLTIGIIIAPWFLQPRLRNSNYNPTAGPPNIPTAFMELLFGATTQNIISLQFLHTTIRIESVHILIAAILLLLSGLTIYMSKNHLPILLFLYTMIPLILLSSLTFITSKGFFRPRYLAASAAPFLLLVFIPISQGMQSKRQIIRYLTISASLISLLLIFLSLNNLYFHTDKAPNYEAITNFLDDHTSTSDIILNNFPDPSFDLYYSGSAPTQLVPPFPNPTIEEITPTLQQINTNYDYIWFSPVPIPWYDGDQIISQWLHSNTQLISDTWIDNNHFLQFSSWEIDPSIIDHHLNVPYSQIATLKGYRFTPKPQYWKRDHYIYLELFFLPRTQTDTNLSIFVHLLGPQTSSHSSPLWAQDDHAPQHNRFETTTWPTDVLFRDVFVLQIPDTAPPGSYKISVGLYDPLTLETIQLHDTIPQAEPNGYHLFSFTLH